MVHILREGSARDHRGPLRRLLITGISVVFLLCIGFFFLWVTNAPIWGFDVKEREFRLDKDRYVVISTQLASPEAPWLVYMPGSGDHLNAIRRIEALDILSEHRAYNILVINKVGLGLNGKKISEEAFQRGSLRPQRIHDNLQVMREMVPANSRILLVALSEGAYIAPEVAQADTRVKGLVLLSGNTWSWLEEEVNYLPVADRQKLRDHLEKDVLPNPVFDQFYGDDHFWSYAYFDSYHTDSTYKTLQKLELPILAINGEKDDVLWIEGAIQNMQKLIHEDHKTNLEFHLLKGADHLLQCAGKAKDCDSEALYQQLKTLLENFSDRTI